MPYNKTYLKMTSNLFFKQIIYNMFDDTFFGVLFIIVMITKPKSKRPRRGDLLKGAEQSP